MVHGLDQIIKLNHRAYLVEMAIKEGSSNRCR